MKSEAWDAIIVGSGIAGMVCALGLPKDFKVALISKKNLEDSNSYLAQGGICVRRGKEDHASFVEDTLRAGQYINDRQAVDILVGESEAAIETLVEYGVEFTKDKDGFSYTREGAHSINRILYCEDQTGKYIMEALIKRIKEEKNIQIFENCLCQDLLVDKERCWGILAKLGQESHLFYSSNTILASGGLGGMYENTTNFSHIEGDGIAMAIKHGVQLKDISYIQIHPTSFYEKGRGKKFLISESVRGEGARLLNHKRERFVDELLPRDIVSKAIFTEMDREEVNHEWLDFSTVEEDIEKRFPNICQTLRKTGIDPLKDLVPVVPAYHYTMGGIQVDMVGKTSLQGLYAVGEVACTGVHGRNRLASNSILEGVVFGKRLAKNLAKDSVDLESLDKIEFRGSVKLPSKEEIKKRIREDEKCKAQQI